MLTAGDTNGTYTFTKDALGREATQKDMFNITVTLTHDAADRLTGVADSLGGTVTNTFDNANRETKTQFTDTSSHALSVTMAYSAPNQETAESPFSDASATTPAGSTTDAHHDTRR